MKTATNEVRFAFRMILRTPLLSVVAIMTMGLGIGAVTFAYSVLDGTLLHGLTGRDDRPLMIVQETRPAEGVEGLYVPLHDYEELRASQTSFSTLSASAIGTVNLAGEEGPPERYSGARVTADLLDGLGVQPILGRGFTEGDDRPGAPALLLLGHNVWKNRFASDPDVVGRTVRVNGESGTVIGVMPPGFRFPLWQDLWLPLRTDTDALPRDSGPLLFVTGVLRDGVSSQAATSEMAALATRLSETYPESNQGVSARVRPYMEGVVPASIASMMWLLLPMVAGVLLVGCANVANILLSRAVAREREVAVRTALGAGRTRLVRQFLLEALLLALAGGVVGLVLAQAALRAFDFALQGLELPYWLVYQMDGTALVATAMATVGAALVAGTLPAIRTSACDLGSVLRDEGRGSSGLRLGRCSHWLVVGEVAISCGLMIGAGLLVRALTDLNRVDLGFGADGVTTARVALLDTEYPDLGDCRRLYHQVLERLHTDPAVQAASLVSALPATAQNRFRVQVEGVSYALPADVPDVGGAVVTPGFFETFSAPLLAGRDFTREESEEGVPGVVIVNEPFVQRYLDGGPALGRRLRVGTGDTGQPWLEIVGVAPAIFEGVGSYGAGGRVREAIYLPLSQATPRFVSLAVKAGAPQETTAALLRSTVAGLDGNLPLYWVQPMSLSLANSTYWHRLFARLFAIFGMASLFLAAVGLYGIVGFSVSIRLHEMGIRKALGAEGQSLAWAVTRRVVEQVGLGAVAGLGLGALLGGPLSAALAGVPSWDPVVIGVILGTLVLTTVAASLGPAIRAIRVDPSTAFRT